MYVSPIPINEVKGILRQVNAHPRKNLEKPFPNLDLATEQFIIAIELHNQTADTLHNSSTLNPRHQKDYFKKLQGRINRLIDFLEDSEKEYLERLHYHQRNALSLEDRLSKVDEGLFPDFDKPDPMPPKKLINALKAYRDAASQLKTTPINAGRKDIHRDDLKQLIHFLFDAYQKCSGRTPGYTYTQRDGKAHQYEGDFVLLIELAIPFANLNNKNGITNNSIGEGIKSVKKDRS